MLFDCNDYVVSEWQGFCCSFCMFFVICNFRLRQTKPVTLDVLKSITLWKSSKELVVSISEGTKTQLCLDYID